MRLHIPALTLHRVPWRALLAVLPLPMLAFAASYGVYEFAKLFVPEWVAIVQAAAFEATYIGLAVQQQLDQRQRGRARIIALGAVVTSIIYNTLAGWFHRQPGLLVAASDIADLMLAILHGAPLAWVAYLVSDLLLHRQASDVRPERVRTRQIAPWPRGLSWANGSNASGNIPDDDQPDDATFLVALNEPEPSRTYTCKYCGVAELTAAELMTHGRKFKRHGDCDGPVAMAAD